MGHDDSVGMKPARVHCSIDTTSIFDDPLLRNERKRFVSAFSSKPVDPDTGVAMTSLRRDTSKWNDGVVSQLDVQAAPYGPIWACLGLSRV